MKRLGILFTPAARKFSTAQRKTLLRKLTPLRLDAVRQISLQAGNLPVVSFFRSAAARQIREVFWISTGNLPAAEKNDTLPLFIESLKAKHPGIDFHFVPGIKV